MMGTDALTGSLTGTVTVLAQQMNKDAPVGPEFGKAEPIGALIVVSMMVVILLLGWAFHRRHSRFNRRKRFAEERGLDVFDEKAVDEAMEAEGLLDRRKKSFF
ncbi:hypothetical protein [Corynebacterium sp. Marseille-P3884]|uniref:hypothetical protein n=1 Tax=Corynebacterium sp. Marseille-P3884 TaxID=2495409 RepID=UPI001B33941C|nr:hypothetical protein [Corynebacterium sp. Marseille-P3884]MBP3948062.1 hypothetical protein [Corynebacterium sp. Marseille-P3884]